MRKSLILALGTIMVVAAGRIGFANAPVFSEVPDVVIGDADFNVGLTVDANFFRYINALNLLDYVSDNDSALTDLKAAFMEQNAAEDLQINGQVQLDGTTELGSDSGTWGTKDLTSAGTDFWLSFRDLVRSPVGGTDPDPLTGLPPFPDPTLADATPVVDPTVAELPWNNNDADLNALADPTFRGMTLFVADEDNVVSQSLLVYSVNASMDGLSGGYTTLFGTDFTAGDPALWEYKGTLGYSGLTQATSSGGNTGNYLGLQDGGAGASGTFFARWQTINDAADSSGFTFLIPAITADQIYQARYTLSALQYNSLPASKINLPTIRIGAYQGSLIFNNEYLIRSTQYQDAVDSQLPDLGATRDYSIFWAPQTDKPNMDQLIVPAQSIDARTWQNYFDLADENTGGTENAGEWRLESWTVVTRARPADLQASDTARFDLTNLTSNNGFATELVSGTAVPAPAENTPAAGEITFTNNGTTAADQYRTWLKFNTAPWEAGKLIRATASMSCPTETDRSNFHLTRVRHAIGFNNLFALLYIQGGRGFTGEPGVPVARTDASYTANGPSAYEMYVAAYGGPAGELLNPGQENLRNWALGLDQVATSGAANSANTTQVTVHDVLYEILDEPSL